jgi:hypothetical protein
MHTVLAVLVSASQMLYEAQVPTFGCSSNAEVAGLQAVRSDANAFYKLLTEQVVHGQCVAIPPGAMVEGAITDTDASMLLINVKSDPPGYVVPLKDFKPQRADARQ